MPCARSSRSRPRGLVGGGRDHPALAAGEALGGVQREAGEVADRSHLAVADGRLDGVRGVLHHRQPVRLGQLARSRPCRTAPPAKCTGSTARVRRSDRRLHEGRVEVQRAGIDVGEHRRRAGVDDRVGGRRPRERGRHHLVARADAGGDQRQVKRGRAGRGGDRVRRARRTAANRCSSSRTRGPEVSQPERSVSITDSTSSSPITGGENESSVSRTGVPPSIASVEGCAAHSTSNLTASTAVRARSSASSRVEPRAIT